MAQASASQDGYLDSADFAAFAAKQDQSEALDDISTLAAGMDKGIFVYDGTSVIKLEPSSSNGDVLSADDTESSGFAWVTPSGGGGGASELSDLDDVEVTGPADGQVLQYDDSVDKFVNRSPSDAGLVEEARTISTSAPLSGGGDLSANRTISMAQASASQDGYLDSADFIAFAAKQDALTEPDDVPGLTVALDDKQDQSGALDDITSLAAGMDKGIFVYDGTSVVKFEPSANNGDVLSADNSEPSGFAWVAPGSGGGLTSPVGISDGGTGATTAAGARTNLDVPSNATLTSGLAGKAASTHTHAATEIGSGTVSNTEFGYLDGVTSNIQSQLDGKAISGHTHAASSITSGTFAVARIPTGISAANISGGTVSNTEFDYLNGVTSAIQTQLNGKTSGSGSSNRLAFWSSTSGLTSDASIYRSGAAIYAGGYYSDSGAFASETTTLYLMSNLTERARFQSGQTFIAGVRNLAAGQLMYWNTSNGEVLYQFSRGAHKEDVKKVDLTIDELMRWRPVEFKWKEKFGGVPDVGLIAEEVAEVYPLAATYDQPWEYLDEKTGEYAVNEDGSPKKLEGDPIVAGVKYEKAWIPMLAAVQDFYGKFKEEQAKTAKLEARLAALEGAKS